MKISIIIPVYNASHYLRECLDSILSQDYADPYEIILVNDGSTDDSLQICQDYEKKYSCIIVLTGKNGGVSAARNKALDVVRGEWLAFVDADDKMLPEALQTLYQRAQMTGADIVLANAVKWQDGKYSKPILSLPNETLPNVILRIKHFALWGYFVRRDFIQDNGIRFVEGLAYSEDRIFIYRLARYCRTIAYTSKSVYAYRINPASACHSKNGLRKAKHHFMAAFHLMQVANGYKQENKMIFNHLCKEAQHVMDLGIYQMLEQNVSWSDLKEAKAFFDKQFSGKQVCACKFGTYAIKDYLTIQRRKIIKFKK